MPSFVIPADPPDPCESPKVELFTPKPVPGLHEAVRLQYSDWSPVYGPESGKKNEIISLATFLLKMIFKWQCVHALAQFSQPSSVISAHLMIGPCRASIKMFIMCYVLA